MDIIRCNSSDTSEWNAFVRSVASGSFYHLAEWRQVNEQAFGHRTCYLAARDHGRVVGVFPLVRLKSVLFGNIACSMPFVNYGGPCAESEEAERRLLDAASSVADEWHVDYLEIRSLRHLGEQYPVATHKVSMTVDLERDPDVLWNRFKTGQRQDIRRAYKNGFTARFGGLDLLDPFYELLSESWRDLGTPIYSKQYLRSVIDAFPGATRICLIVAGDGTPAAGAFVGHHAGTVEGMWLGTREQYRRHLVGYVLYWELIKDACEHGFDRFHLGRSTADSGGEQFKKKWNARPTQLYWQYVLRKVSDIPQLNVTNSKYQFAIKTWRKLPVGLTQQIGPMIARSIP